MKTKTMLSLISLLVFSAVFLVSNGKEEVSERQKQLIDSNLKMLGAKEGLVGFSDEGLVVCFLKIEDNNEGVLITVSQASNGHQKSFIRNLKIASGGFRFDLIDGKTNKKDSFCTGSVKGFALTLVFHNMDDTFRGYVTLVRVEEIQSLLKIGQAQGRP